jgi:putative peptide zinc metalloprotease protein
MGVAATDRGGADMAVAVGQLAGGTHLPPQPTAQQLPPLPPLREDIRLMPGPSTHAGAPTWTLYDPALHRFLRIGRLEFEILCHWRLGRADLVAAAVAASTTFAATVKDVLEVLRFVDQARLVAPQGSHASARLVAEAAARRLSAPQWLLKNYLYVRLRLLNPDHLLTVLLRWMGWMLTRGFALVLGGLAVLGLYLIGQQWDAYTHSFLNMFTLQGVLQVGVALTAAKLVHELGHGLMAKHFGCRVPAMGIAMVVMWPVAWTDCTDAWRLTDRRQRLAIDSAGMLAEIALAVFASLAWSVLPDGAARTGAFMLSSSTWLVTVAINVNPLMRFDGYFLLSDWLDEPNLQPRGFALARWWVREVLFGLGDNPPEKMAAGRRRFLIGYALCCWIYRFSLFLGIALVVYHFTFKLLGLFLMVVEVGWFIVRPIVAEMAVWGHRTNARGWTPRSLVTAGVVITILAMLALPWQGDVTAPALLRAERHLVMITAAPGQLVQATANNTSVAAGQTLFILNSPDTAYQRDDALARVEGLKTQLVGQAFDPGATRDLPVTWSELEGAMAQLRSAEATQALLITRAPFSGVLMDVPRGLAPGEWLPRHDSLGILVDPRSQIVEAELNEADLARVHPGQAARFWSEDGTIQVPLVVRSISPGAVGVLETPELASIFGGGVAVRREADGRLVPETAVYRVVFDVDVGAVAAATELRRGTVHITADRISPMSSIWRRAVAVVMREAGP